MTDDDVSDPMGIKVIVFGASGMVGQGVLLECLLDPRVESVLSVGRSPTGRSSPKLQEILLPDPGDLSTVEGRVQGYDGGFFCLGVSSVGRTEEEYRKVTYDLTVRAAETLARLNPAMTFTYVSGTGTDSTEHGRTMWARVKGQTENALFRLPFKAAYMFRPGIIQPRRGVRSKTPGVRWGYTLLWPVVALLKAVAPNSITTTENMGKSMIQVALSGAPTRILSTREINALAAASRPT